MGVSMPFIAADAAGACFSLLSLAFREEFDLLAALNYVVVLICDVIVVAFFVYFNKLHPELARVRKATMDEEQAAAAVKNATVAGGPPFRLDEAQSTNTTFVGTEEEFKASSLGQEQQQTPLHHPHHHSLSAFLQNGTTIPNHIHATPVLPKGEEHPPKA